MAFRANSVIPATEYVRAKNLAVQLDRLAVNRSASFATGANSAEILALVDNLSALKAGLQDAAQTPGIEAYATAQEDDATYLVAVEFAAMIAAVDAVIAETVTTLPTDANDWLLIRKINADGSLVPRTFTGAQLASIRSLLDSLAASIT